MVAAAVTTAPRYAPPDPTLPLPWRALVDGNTGYIYYWNPETNVTQYDKPLPPAGSVPPPLPAGPHPASVISGPKLAPIPTNSTDLHNGGSINGHLGSINGFHGTTGGGLPVQPKLAAIPVPRGPQVRVFTLRIPASCCCSTSVYVLEIWGRISVNSAAVCYLPSGMRSCWSSTGS